MAPISFLSIALLAAASLFASTPLPAAEARAPAVFVFGDSTADVGNNNFLPAGIKVNFPHYGVDFPRRLPTGRFSNGYNGVDFVAKMLGFKQSPPPYLAIKNRPAELLHGVSYASGGSGILDVTGQNVSLSLNTQIAYFNKTVEAIATFAGEQHAGELLSKAVFLFLTGNNDMFGFYAKFAPLNETQKEQFVALLAVTLKGQLQEVHELGARKFAVIGTTLLGCVPRLRALSPGQTCAEDLNDLSRRYNAAVKAVLAELSAELEGMQYSFTNSYRVVGDVVANPLHFGYKELKSACCGGGVLNALTACMPNATFCSERKEFLFWDGVHPTQKTYRLVAKHAYRGSPLYATPVNIQQLARS